MRTILHILTKTEDDLTRIVIDQQRALPETNVEVVALATDADYSAVIDKIFAAHSIEVW